jgi:uncharacterized glyoxalase superfamily protein PhnB
MIKGADQFITFMAAVFGAKVTEQLMQADGKPGHTELRVGDSLIMLSEARADRPQNCSVAPKRRKIRRDYIARNHGSQRN